MPTWNTTNIDVQSLRNLRLSASWGNNYWPPKKPSNIMSVWYRGVYGGPLKLKSITGIHFPVWYYCHDTLSETVSQNDTLEKVIRIPANSEQKRRYWTRISSYTCDQLPVENCTFTRIAIKSLSKTVHLLGLQSKDNISGSEFPYSFYDTSVKTYWFWDLQVNLLSFSYFQLQIIISDYYCLMSIFLDFTKLIVTVFNI